MIHKEINKPSHIGPHSIPPFNCKCQLNTLLHNTLFLVEELPYLFYVLLLCPPFSLVFSLFLSLAHLCGLSCSLLSHSHLSYSFLFYLCSSSHFLFSFPLVFSFPLLVFLLLFFSTLLSTPLLVFLLLSFSPLPFFFRLPSPSVELHPASPWALKNISNLAVNNTFG